MDNIDILLIDENDGGIAGHNGIYRETLRQIKGTAVYNQCSFFPSLSKHPINGLVSRFKYIYSIPKSNIACFLHLDNLYAMPPLWDVVRKKHKHIVGVLHWYPNEQKRKKLLFETSKKLDRIIVHSEYIESQLRRIGINNVMTIDYPVFCNVDIEKMKKSNNCNKKVFTMLGGCRLDKGPDILTESFKYIPYEYRDKIRIVVAGKELDFPYSFMEKEAKSNCVEVFFDNRRMDNEDYWQHIVDTDVILLPYKKIFTGNSGPMTDGIFLNKYILGPKQGNLGFLIEKYRLGSTFEIEDPMSLGKEIGRISTINTVCSHEYRERLSIQCFISSYKKMFEEVSRL